MNVCVCVLLTFTQPSSPEAVSMSTSSPLSTLHPPSSSPACTADPLLAMSSLPPPPPMPPPPLPLQPSCGSIPGCRTTEDAAGGGPLVAASACTAPLCAARTKHRQPRSTSTMDTQPSCVARRTRDALQPSWELTGTAESAHTCARGCHGGGCQGHSMGGAYHGRAAWWAGGAPHRVRACHAGMAPSMASSKMRKRVPACA